MTTSASRRPSVSQSAAERCTSTWTPLSRRVAAAGRRARTAACHEEVPTPGASALSRAAIPNRNERSKPASRSGATPSAARPAWLTATWSATSGVPGPSVRRLGALRGVQDAVRVRRARHLEPAQPLPGARRVRHAQHDERPGHVARVADGQALDVVEVDAVVRAHLRPVRPGQGVPAHPAVPLAVLVGRRRRQRALHRDAVRGRVRRCRGAGERVGRRVPEHGREALAQLGRRPAGRRHREVHDLAAQVQRVADGRDVGAVRRRERVARREAVLPHEAREGGGVAHARVALAGAPDVVRPAAEAPVEVQRVVLAGGGGARRAVVVGRAEHQVRPPQVVLLLAAAEVGHEVEHPVPRPHPLRPGQPRELGGQHDEACEVRALRRGEGAARPAGERAETLRDLRRRGVLPQGHQDGDRAERLLPGRVPGRARGGHGDS